MRRSLPARTFDDKPLQVRQSHSSEEALFFTVEKEFFLDRIRVKNLQDGIKHRRML